MVLESSSNLNCEIGFNSTVLPTTSNLPRSSVYAWTRYRTVNPETLQLFYRRKQLNARSERAGMVDPAEMACKPKRVVMRRSVYLYIYRISCQAESMESIQFNPNPTDLTIWDFQPDRAGSSMRCDWNVAVDLILHDWIKSPKADVQLTEHIRRSATSFTEKHVVRHQFKARPDLRVRASWVVKPPAQRRQFPRCRQAGNYHGFRGGIPLNQNGDSIIR